MCGRFCVIFSYDELLAYFNLTIGKIEPRYNVALPGDPGGAVGGGLAHSRLIAVAPGFSTINARSETAHTSPTFRSAFRHRRRRA